MRLGADQKHIDGETRSEVVIHDDDRSLRTLALTLVLQARPAYHGEQMLKALDDYLTAREERLISRMLAAVQSEGNSLATRTSQA